MTPTRMAMNTALYPQTTGVDLTPDVRDALDLLGERERHLTAVIDRALPFGLSFFRRWIASGLPLTADGDRTRRLRESRADVESTSVLETLLGSLALVEQAINEFEHPRPGIRFRRAYRRIVRAREIVAAKIERRRHRAGFPYGVE